MYFLSNGECRESCARPISKQIFQTRKWLQPFEQSLHHFVVRSITSKWCAAPVGNLLFFSFFFPTPNPSSFYIYILCVLTVRLLKGICQAWKSSTTKIYRSPFLQDTCTSWTRLQVRSLSIWAHVPPKKSYTFRAVMPVSKTLSYINRLITARSTTYMHIDDSL